MSPAISAAIAALSENDLAILQRDLNGKAQQDRMMPTDHDKLREAIREAKANLGRSCLVSNDAIRLLVAAAESTLPCAKMVETWHVEYTIWVGSWEPRVEVCVDEVIAEARALGKRQVNPKSCIRVTGPHQQEVPA